MWYTTNYIHLYIIVIHKTKIESFQAIKIDIGLESARRSCISAFQFLCENKRALSEIQLCSQSIDRWFCIRKSDQFRRIQRGSH